MDSAYPLAAFAVVARDHGSVVWRLVLLDGDSKVLTSELLADFEEPAAAFRERGVERIREVLQGWGGMCPGGAGWLERHDDTGWEAAVYPLRQT